MRESRSIGHSLVCRWLRLSPALLLVAVAIALLGAGCGGPSPDERFAENTCSTILPRAQALLEFYDEVRHTRAAPGPDAKTKQLRLILGGEEVTRKLRVELRKLPVPNTNDGRRAAAYLDNFTRFAFEAMVVEERRVAGLPENISLLQSIRSLDQLELALIDAVSNVRDAPATIMTQVPKLKEPFEKADSCEELAALGTD